MKRTQGRSSPVSLATLSAHLGLSQAAISRVLNRVPAAQNIPPATQERIFAAAREFNYRPNVLARSLRRGHSMTVGVLVPEISEGYTMLVLAGLEQGLMEAGYAFFLCSHRHQEEVIQRSQALLLERAVDGMVAIDTTLREDPRLPTVTVSCPSQAHDIVNILLDQEQAVALALDHLYELGHREIAVIKGQDFSSDTHSRWQATERSAARLGLTLNPRLVAQLEGDAPTHEPGYLATRRLLDTGTHFTALLAFNDVSAIGAIRAFHEMGLQVPRDISVIGFDDVQSAAFQNPALTTVRQPLYSMGLMAAREIVKVIGKSPVTDHAVTLKPELIVRESTGYAMQRAILR